MGSILDPVISKAPCNIVILKDECKNKQFHRVLVPLFGSANDPLAMETAELLLFHEEGELVLLNLHGKRKRDDYGRNLFSRIVKSSKVEFSEVDSKSSDSVQAILDASQGCDLAVVGVEGPGLFRMGRKTLTETVATELTIPFALVKASGRVEEWAKRIL